MIIGINGYSGSGKDTVGTIIQYLSVNDNNQPTTSLEDVLDFPITHEWWLEEQSGWEIKKWAGKLKEIASMLTGIPKHKFEDQEFKKTLLGPEWGTVKDIPLNSVPVFADMQFNTLMSVRDFLQKLGTDAIRDGLHTNAWVNSLMADYTPTQVQWSDGPLGGYEDGPMPNWIITDTRFPNEAQAIKDAGGLVIRVDRPGVKPINDHPSEIGLDNWKFDYKIANISDIKALSLSVKIILEKENIL
jgi:hypothetical protein